ncbi:MAG: 4-hydroxy-2-oxovalerate aldolase [Planctomycetaceae bacterium]|nr:4-hydroxy-2-oxovalerate aldolase [Planctomycetaceae bacterium]
MRRSKTLARIRDGQVVRMCALGHYIPSFIKHAAVYGYDCIWLDLEHRFMDDREVQALLAYSHLCDIDIMVRPSTRERARLYRYLEDGAAGIMIPHVSTPEEALALAQAVKFPPIGNRGLDGAGLDADFYHQPTGEYVDAANRETFLVVQIETPLAVQNVGAIAATPGVDGLFLGPADLSLRIQKERPDLTLDGCRKAVAEAARKHHKAWGQPAPSREMAGEFAKAGAQLLVRGGDYGAIMTHLRECSNEFAELSMSGVIA